MRVAHAHAGRADDDAQRMGSEAAPDVTSTCVIRATPSWVSAIIRPRPVKRTPVVLPGVVVIVTFFEPEVKACSCTTSSLTRSRTSQPVAGVSRNSTCPLRLIASACASRMAADIDSVALRIWTLAIQSR